MTKYDYLMEIIDYIRKNEIYDFADIVDYACDNKVKWFECICDNTYIIVKYLESREEDFD